MTSNNGSEMYYEDFLRIIDDLAKPLPFDQGTLRLFLDSLSILISQWGQEAQTVIWFDQGLETIAKGRLSQVAGVSSSDEEIDRLLTHIRWGAVVYRHSLLLEEGRPLVQCSFDPPCPFH